MKTFLLLLSLFVGIHLAKAQFGLTPEECAQRFGKPLRENLPDPNGIKTATYRSKTHDVKIGFKDGKTCFFLFNKLTRASMTEDEISALLNSFGDEHQKWFKNVITGERRSAVNTSARYRHNNPFRDKLTGPERWHVLGKKDLAAAYYIEKHILVLWTSKAGIDADSILGSNPF